MIKIPTVLSRKSLAAAAVLLGATGGCHLFDGLGLQHDTYGYLEYFKFQYTYLTH